MPAFYIVLEKELPGADVYVNGNFMSKHSDALDRLAKQLGVRTLLSFFSISPEEIASVVEVESVDSLKGNPKHVEKWFAAEDGLRTVSALLENLPGSGIGDPDRVEANLREFVHVLEFAKTSGTRWHLAIDY
jgi:hypothetical protein